MRIVTQEMRDGISRKLMGHSVSEETRRKISVAGRGRKYQKSREHLLKISNALAGRKLSAEHRNKLSLAKLGKPLSADHRKKIGESNTGKNVGKIRTPEMRLAMSLRLRGSSASNWRGGLNEKKYCDGWRIIRESIRQRDRNTCRICNAVGGKRKLSVHHIDYSRDNNNPNNLITVCGKCHGATGFNRESWGSYFNTLLQTTNPNQPPFPVGTFS